MWPSSPSAAKTSLLGLPILRLHLLAQILVDLGGTDGVEKGEDFEFLFHVFGAFEFAGEEIIHHQRGDESRDAEILLRIVVEHMKFEFFATIDQPREQFVHPIFFLIGPLADRIHQPPPPQAQIRARFDPPRAGRRGEKLPQIGVVKIRIRVLVELSFARVIGLELDVETIVVGGAIRR